MIEAFNFRCFHAKEAMPDTSQIKEHMDVISSDRKTVGLVDHLDGSDKIKLTSKVPLTDSTTISSVPGWIMSISMST